MLYDRSCRYEEIDEVDYNELLDLYEGKSEVKGKIYSFYEDKEKNIHKLIDLDIPDNKWNLLSKYYVISMDLESDMPRINERLIHIINLGYFIIREPFKLTDIEDKLIFDNYDKNYKNLNFNFTDEEFLEKYNYFNEIKIYKNGEILNYNDELFTNFLNKINDKNNFENFQYVLVYAYKGKELNFIVSVDIDTIMNNSSNYKRCIINLLNEKCADTGVVYKKNNNKYDLVFRIGY